jgi:hypothetical protein
MQATFDITVKPGHVPQAIKGEQVPSDLWLVALEVITSLQQLSLLQQGKNVAVVVSKSKRNVNHFFIRCKGRGKEKK